MAKTYYFRIVTYRNGKLVDLTDAVPAYRTKKEAIDAAQYAADYWHLVRGKCSGEFQRTPEGAIRWWTDELGNRYRREYKVIAGAE